MSKEERKALVKELRAVARELGVDQIRDDCGRSKVQEWFQTVVKAAKSKKKPELKAKAETAFAKYESTWRAENSAPTTENEERAPLRLPRVRTCQRHLEKSTSVCRRFRQLLYHVFGLIRDTLKNPFWCAESFDNFYTTCSDSSETLSDLLIDCLTDWLTDCLTE